VGAHFLQNRSTDVERFLSFMAFLYNAIHRIRFENREKMEELGLDI
jgi:hypothetical protein